MALREQGYQFDFVSDRQLQKVTPGEDGLESGGAHYQVIAIPETNHMPVATLEKLLELAEKGATICFFGDLPKRVPGLADRESRETRLGQLTSSLGFTPIGEAAVLMERGEGKVMRTGAGLGLKCLDLASVEPEAMVGLGLKCIRRVHEEGYHYFIANLDSQAVDGWVPFARAAASAVILDPLTGESGVAATRTNEARTEIYLQLEPGQTCIVRTFTEKRVQGKPWPILQTAGDAVEISGNWQVDFVDGGPKLPASFSTRELRSWTELGDDESRRFAGTVRYRIEFDLPAVEADDWRLELGDVRESARVYVNGRDAGTRFAFPFTMRVGRFLKRGKNTFEIEVTNLSANRIRDLDARKVPWKKFHDINFVNHNYKQYDASKWPMTPSGLLDPIGLVPLTN
jgi:hypothetical protein